MALMNIEYIIREIVYSDGKSQIICMTNQQYSGFMRRKGIKKKIIVTKKLFSFKITTKNFIK